MERNRESRRVNTPAMNGNGGSGISRRKQRSNALRDYPEDGVMEMHETPRLRDRGGKKDRDRDRDRFSRNKRRRMFHGDDADETSEESVDDEVDDDEAAVRHPPVNHAAPSAAHNHHHSERKGLVSWMPPWDEINLSVPRKARSKGATVKRIHEPWVSVGGGGEHSQRQFSTSPSRLSPSASQISSNSNKMKSLGGTKKQQPPSSAEELEIAEVLAVLRTKEECSIKIDKTDDNVMSNEGKSLIRSPNSISQQPPNAAANAGSNAFLAAVAPKRKRPRHVSTVFGQSNTLAFSPDKLVEEQPAQHEACLPKSEMLAPSPAIENGGTLHGVSSLQSISTPMVNQEQEQENLGREELKLEVLLPKKEMPPTNVDKAMTEKISPVAKNLRKEKFTIDLMAPPEKSSPERDGLCDFGSEGMPVAQEYKPVSEIVNESNGVTRKIVDQNGAESLMNGVKAEKSIIEDSESMKKLSKGKAIDLQFDLENAHNMDTSKLEMPKQQSTSSKVDTQSDKTVPTSLSMPTTMAGWPGSFPQFGYMAQVPSLPAIMPSMDAATGSSSILQPPNMPPPPVKGNRCSKHLYIAQSIQYNQKFIQTNSYWHASAGAAQLFVPKPPANLNVMPPLDPILGNPLQGGVPGRSLGSLQDTKVAPYFAAFTGQPSNANIAEAGHRTHLGLPQMPPQHPGLSNNMIPSPALFYPINQHQAMAAAAAAAAVRSGAGKSSTGVGSVAPSSAVSSSAVASSGGGGAAVAMNLGYSTEQYLAILQNSGYPIPLPAHLGGPPAYRGGTNPSPTMPPFSGPFYQSQMLHHSQLQPTSESAPQKPAHTQPGHPNTSTSTGSSSSQKQQQQQLQRVAGGGSNDAGTSSHGLPSQKQHHSRPIENEAGGEDGPSSADSRVLQAQKSLYAHNMAMSIHSQNAAMLSTAAAASGLKHTQQQQPAMKGDLTPSQAFAMSYASNNGGASLSGMNYSSMAQGHALFQSLPDITRQGYQMNMAAAAAAAEAATSAQQKKTHSQAIENGKSADSVKSSGIGGSQHFSSFAKPDNERPTNTSHGHSVVESSSGAANSNVRTSNRSTNATGGLTNAASTLTTPNFQQFQLHRAQELQMQRLASAGRAKSTSTNNAGVYSGSTAAKFPQTVAGFSHGLTQSGSPTQPQWKTSGRAGTPTPTTTADQLTSRNQQQPRSGLTSSHQANISFGANSMKSSLAGAHAGSGTANVYASSTAGALAPPSHGSPSNSISKSNGGSPRASASENQTTPANTPTLPPQSYTKSSTSSSSRKSSPTENVPTNPGHTQQKQLQQMQQHYLMQSQQPVQKQTQFFFNGTGAYMQAQAPQSSAAAASIFYRQQLEQQQSSHQQQQQKQSSNPASAGLTLAGSSGAYDPSKAGGAASNSMKGMPPPGLLHAAHTAAPGMAHPLMSAMFPYMSMPSTKPGDQKPATGGNDNLNASWQPEKRS